jgi:hypothetical protein
VPRLVQLGGENTTGSYKPGPQARFLVEQMEQTEKQLLDSIAKLAEHLQSVEGKVDKFAGDLEAVQSKVVLAMASINLVQQEQVQVEAMIQSRTSSSGVLPGDGVMGAPPGSSSSGLGASHTSAPAQSSQPPPRQQQVNHQTQLSGLGSLLHAKMDRQEPRRPWLLKMDFPHFDGSDVRIWLDKCAAYFAMY